MPLLGQVIFNEPSYTGDVSEKTEVYKIPHTQELFTSKEEYEERVQLYNRKVWTCQCTGHINLTHKEALESESKCRENLAKSFPEVYKAPILGIAHHSRDVLDAIVNRAYKFVRSQLMVGENVQFEPRAGEAIEAKILDICHDPISHRSVDGSPSSDKENSSTKQSLITDLFPTVGSPEENQKSSETAADSDALEKIRENIKYRILLRKENKIISDVPSSTLKSTNRPPSRHNIRLFVRANAIRYSNKKLRVWIVNKNLVEKHNLVGNLSLEEEEHLLCVSSIKSQGFVGYTHHSPHLTNGVVNHNGDVPKSTNCSVVVHNGNGEQLSPVAKTNSDIPDSKPVKLAPIFSPPSKKRPEKHNFMTTELHKAPEVAEAGESVKFETHVKTLPPPEKMPKSKPTERKRKRKEVPDAKQPPKKRGKKSTKAKIAKTIVKASPSKASGSSRKSTSPKKKKQATLLELTKKKGGMMLMKSTKSPALGSSLTSPAIKKKPRATRQPPIVYHLINLKKEKNFRKNKYLRLLHEAAKKLNSKQLQNLPEVVKEDIMKKWRAIEHERKLQEMTPEERKKHRAEERMKINKKFEDMDIALNGKAKCLPTLELVTLPNGIPNTLFGDIAMVTEFLHSYKSLLSSKEPKIITQRALTEAVVLGKQGYDVIGYILTLMFQMLLSDDISQDYKELDFHIDQVPVTSEVCSELARICLRKVDEEVDDEMRDKSDDQIEEDILNTMSSGVSETLYLKLMENEIFELDPIDQLEVLSALSYLLINTYSAQNYRDEMKDRSTEAYKRLNKLREENNILKREQKKLKKEQKDTGKPNTLPKMLEKKTEKVESQDLISRVKRRRIETAERKQEQEERRMQEDEEKKKYFEERAKEAENEKILRQANEAFLLASRSLRLDSLGTDRFHNRYRIFSDCTPGLYIEKGWVQDYITYTTQDSTPSPSKQVPDLELSSDDDIPLSLLSSPMREGHKVSSKEMTTPHVGQNLWFVVDSVEKLDDLLNCLCTKGIREGKLKMVLEKKYNALVRTINKYQSTMPMPPQPTEDGDDKATSPTVTRKSTAVKCPYEAAKKAIRKRIVTIVHSLSKGGLTKIMIDQDVMLARVESADLVKDFSSIILDIFNAVDMRFFREYMTGIPTRKKLKREEILPYDEQEKSENPKKIAKAEKRRELWMTAVKNATHYSRLSLLLSVLNSSVMWEMFKYSRTIPKRSSARIKNYADMVADDQEEDEEEVEEEEDDEDDDIHPAGVRRSTRLNGRSDIGLRRSRRHQYDEAEEGEETGDDEDRDSEENDDENDEEDEGSNVEEDEEEEEEDEETIALAKCSTIINRLTSYKCSTFFRYPVELQDVPDYYEVINSPISLSEISTSVENALKQSKNSANSSRGSFSRKSSESDETYTPHQLLDDMKLLLDNAMMYNGTESLVWRQALKLKDVFQRCFLDNFGDSSVLKRHLRRNFT